MALLYLSILIVVGIVFITTHKANNTKKIDTDDDTKPEFDVWDEEIG